MIIEATVANPLFPPEAIAGRGAARKSEAAYQVLLLLVALSVAAGAGLYGPLAVRETFRPVDLPRLLAAVLAAVVLHEAGHLLAALALQFHFLGLALGPFRLQTMHGQWKVSVSGESIFAASVSASPSNLNEWRWSLLIVTAAGPAVTLSSAVFGFYALGHFPGADPLLLAAFVQVNALLAFLCLIPNAENARVRNDARLVLMLISNCEAMQEIELAVALTHLAVEGAAPADYPRTLLVRLARWRGRPEAELVFAQALVRWALDSDEWTLAEKWDARALALSEHCTERMRNQALAMSACLDVISRNDLEAARKKLAGVKTAALFPKYLEHRSNAARGIALGRTGDGSADIIRAQYALPRGIAACNLERRLLASLHMLILNGKEASGRVLAASA